MANPMNLLLKHSKLTALLLLLMSAFLSIYVWNATKSYYDVLNQEKFNHNSCAVVTS